MLYDDRIDLSRKIDPDKNINSEECIVCHYCFSNRGIKFQNSICNGCQDFTMSCLDISDMDLITVKGVAYLCLIHNISKYKAIFCWKTLCLMILGVYKMYIKEINIKNRVNVELLF